MNVIIFEACQCMDLVRHKIIVNNILIVGLRTNALLINILVFLMVYIMCFKYLQIQNLRVH